MRVHNYFAANKKAVDPFKHGAQIAADIHRQLFHSSTHLLRTDDIRNCNGIHAASKDC